MPTSDEERNRDPGPVVTAFHRLYVEMLPDGPRQSVEERVEPRVSAVALDAALDKIAKDEAVSPLVKLHGVASLVKHRPTLAVDQSDLLVAVVQSTLETPVSVETTVLATRLQEFAEHYRGSEGGSAAPAARRSDSSSGLSPVDWKQFMDTVLRDAVTTVPPRVMKPGCRDDEVVYTDGEEAPTIVSRFWTDLPLAQLERYVDPLGWKEIGDGFWLEMKAVDGPHVTSTGYSGTFEEIVSLPTGPLTAFLDITFERSAQTLCTTFTQAAGNWPGQEVEVDSGYVFATTETTAPSKMAQPVLVYATKSIVFVDGRLNGYADLACDNGWVQLMINMAMKSPQRGDAAASSTRADSGGAPRDLVAEWAAQARNLVEQTAEIAHEAPELLATGQDVPALVDKILLACDQATRATTVGARAWRDGIERFVSKAGGR